MIVKVVYKNGDVQNERMSVDDAALRLKTDCDVQSIIFSEDSANKLLEKRLEQLLVHGSK
ncbi:hypothetical protein QM190_06855 [Enterobacter hormaechei]|jgi:hypothetical protein|uniref:hypothetical protein n=1 Tax=Enterobacter cloacae complex TaxID=354276 RepID=UPI0007985561|nr:MULTISPECIES: hypothetical protein [Enterobacter cloacae complex]MBJ6511407.1 hypothetical protein [Enterobacter hormaechei]MBJ6608686.1 hypothetical protein [Enterobacter hormaechei]MBK4232636.1 hypothetical protein [Enterobacter hormaechei]MBK4323812.1 hypothetical protein [Enterobacter hormaechei]MBK4340599.1 hypothetical protein [Enterobacter hormaechei]